jgi:hypothetical protein
MITPATLQILQDGQDSMTQALHEKRAGADVKGYLDRHAPVIGGYGKSFAKNLQMLTLVVRPRRSGQQRKVECHGAT